MVIIRSKFGTNDLEHDNGVLKYALRISDYDWLLYEKSILIQLYPLYLSSNVILSDIIPAF